MVDSLDIACHQSTDPPHDSAPVVMHESRTGRPGRPRIEIDVVFLQHALEHRGPTRIANAMPASVSARTIRRRGVELGLLEPQPPVFEEQINENGEVFHIHNSSTAPVSTLTDEELYELVYDCLQQFPSSGRRMTAAFLRAKGHHVPIVRVAAAHLRVKGVPGVFGGRQVRRKVYQVAGPNSLWHHDGQHGLFCISLFFKSAQVLMSLQVSSNMNL